MSKAGQPRNSMEQLSKHQHRRPDEKDVLAEVIKSIGFAKTAFGIEAQWEDRLLRCKQSTEVRSKEFESHFDDHVL